MKISFKGLLLCAAAALSLCAAGTASAVSVLNFAGSVVLKPPTLGTATQITRFSSINNANVRVQDTLRVQDGDGIFASLTPGTQFNAFGPLVFGNGLNPLFSLGAFSFVLDDSNIETQTSKFLNISGTGTIFGPGGFELPAELLLSSQGGIVRGRYSVSGSLITQDVPEGGSAVLFLGLGLIGVESLRRLKSRA